MAARSLFTALGARTVCVCALGLAFTSVVWADPCEPLRERIESQIRAKGVRDFALTVVPVDADVPGKAVGWCAAGQRKVVYRRGVVETAPAANVPSPAAEQTAARAVTDREGSGRVRVQIPVRVAPITPTTRTKVITECRDGLVIIQGDCPG